MSPRFEQHIHFLQLIIHASARQTNALLKTSSKEHRLAIIELIFNFLKGSFLVQEKVQTRFCKYKNILRKLAKKSNKTNVTIFIKNSLIIKEFIRIAITKLT